MNTQSKYLVASQKALMQNLLAYQGAFFESFEKLVELNLETSRAAMQRNAARTELSLHDSSLPERGDYNPAEVSHQMLAYQREVRAVLVQLRSRLRALVDAQTKQNKTHIQDIVSQLETGAPQGSEDAIALLKASVAVVTEACQSATDASRQATETLESNLTTLADSVTGQPKSTGKRAAK